VRVALAAALLRHGRTPDQVAETTGLPFALVDWLAEHTTPRETDHTQNAAATPSRKAAVTADLGASTRRVYRHVRSIAPFSLGWLLSCMLSVIAVLYRQPIIGAITVALSTVLLVASTVVIARYWWRRARPGRRD
jgi:hypothetical protein